MKIDIKSKTLTELKAEISALSLPSFRAAQIYRWLHKSGVSSFGEMTDLSLSLREQIDDKFVIFGCSIEKKLVSLYDGTVKYLFSLHDGEFIECVLMKYSYGYTLCISTQVGCKMACTFCASGLGGFVRNLCAGEMLSQIHAAQNDMNIRVSHVVLMGMGEPLDNFEETMRFLELVSDENGLNISMRNISLSTCGLVPKIYELMEKKLQLTLSVSLHAPNDELRNKIMPVNKVYGVDELFLACRRYSISTKRRVSFEYIMIDGFNDTTEAALELASKLRGIICHINIIPANEVRESSYRASGEKKLENFKEILTGKGYTVTVRRKLGADINASCGQLRRKSVNDEKSKGLSN